MPPSPNKFSVRNLERFDAIDALGGTPMGTVLCGGGDDDEKSEKSEEKIDGKLRVWVRFGSTTKSVLVDREGLDKELLIKTLKKKTNAKGRLQLHRIETGAVLDKVEELGQDCKLELKKICFT